MKSHKNQKNQKELGSRPTDVAKNATTKTESFSIDGDHLVMYLHDSGAKNGKYVRVDFNDYYTFDKFYMIMDRKTLKGMADFIYKYLENN